MKGNESMGAWKWWLIGQVECNEGRGFAVLNCFFIVYSTRVSLEIFRFFQKVSLVFG